MEENSNNNSLHEPTAEYGVARKAKTANRQERKPAIKNHAKAWWNERPYTREELRERILVVQAEINDDTGDLTDVERAERLENDITWLSELLERLPEAMEELNNPKPRTKEELVARVEKSTAEVALGKGITLDELFRRMDLMSALWK